MVRRLNARGWGGLLLVAVAGGAILWHVLACVESPMSFAPNGDLAFTTMEPYGGEGNDVALRGARVYRLMLLPKGARAVKVLEESSDWMITAPAFSPDGKKIAYLRIPLLGPGDEARLEEAFTKSAEAKSACTQPVDFQWPPVADKTPPTTSPADETESVGMAEVLSQESELDAVLPPLAAQTSTLMLPSLPIAPAQLVQRDAATGKVLSVTAVQLPLAPLEMGKDGKGFSSGLAVAYIVSRPQYSPDGQSIYFCPGNVNGIGIVWQVSLADGKMRAVAGPAMTALLSTDGKTLVAIEAGCLAFVRTDGSMTSYVRWESGASPSGMTWVDSSTLAIMGTAKQAGKEGPAMLFVKPDGTVVRTVLLPELKENEGADTGQLAISPNGKRIVVAFDKGGFFLDADGRQLSGWADPNNALAHPTFTPDGKEVAFKYVKMGEGEKGRAEAIVFFSPEGKELRRVAIPPAKLPETQPAHTGPSAQAGGPAATTPAPDFEVPTLDGGKVKLSDYRGRWVLLDFWATWCGPCRGETPHLKAAWDAYGSDPSFAMIGLSLDDDQDAPRQYVQANTLGWIHGFLGEWSQAKVPDQYGVHGIPAIFLIDPDGRIAAKGLRGEQIIQALKQRLGKARPPTSSPPNVTRQR